MGQHCSKKSAVDILPGGERAVRVNGFQDGQVVSNGSHAELSGEEGSSQNPEAEGLEEDKLPKVLSQKSESPWLKPAGAIKVSEMSARLGRAGSFGLGKAVDVLDTLGSSVSSLSSGGNFVTGVGTKGTKISILAFEVANTIAKGVNLMLSISEENIKHLRDVILPSEGVRLLVSKDSDELLMIAAEDKREELKVFSNEVVRFGNRCKDPQWHNLDRYFDKLGTEVTPRKQFKEETPKVIQKLMIWVQYTGDLYNELQVLDRLEQDCRRKQEEEGNLTAVQNGSVLQILKQELKSQRKHIKSLKKKSLWSKILEEVIENLVDMVHILHLEIRRVFHSTDGDQLPRKCIRRQERLGAAGLALHYASIISQIEAIVTRSHAVPSSTRDALYQALPPRIKSSLRAKLQSFHPGEELLSAPQIRADIEKTLCWLLPVASNTTKIHHGFGWVGEWANLGSDPSGGQGGHQTNLNRLETLYHADKEMTEAYILDLVVLLHHLINLSKPNTRSPIKSPIRSPVPKYSTAAAAASGPSQPPHAGTLKLTREDEQMLRDVTFRRLIPGISRSQEFETAKPTMANSHKVSKSCNHSPSREAAKEPSSAQPARRAIKLPAINFESDKPKSLDVIDRVDGI